MENNQEGHYRTATKSTYPVTENPKHPILDDGHALRNFGLHPQTAGEELDNLIDEIEANETENDSD